jgi:AcrR family transcriptional regulator
VKRPDLLEGVSGPRAPRQKRSLERRDAILAAAITVFGRDGYEGASVRRIASEAGAATGAVSQFFGSKRRLLLVSMDALLARIERVRPPEFVGTRPLAADMQRFLTGIFRRERPFVGVYRAWREAALIDPWIADRDRRIRVWSGGRIQALFTRLGSRPGARPDLDFEALAHLWDRFFWELLAKPPKPSARAARVIASILSHTLFSDGLVERERNPDRGAS